MGYNPGPLKFGGTLTDRDQQRVANCDARLTDPARLAAVRETGLLDTESDEALERLAHLAARILKVPLTIVSLVTDRQQLFKAAHGLPAPYDKLRQVPIEGSICRYTLHGEPIVVADAARDPFLSLHPTTKPWGIAAFMAIPMVTPAGHVLGAFCAVDSEVRRWSEDDVYVMQELTLSVMTEINLRRRLNELNTERNLRETFVSVLTHDLRAPITNARLRTQLLMRNANDADYVRQSGRHILAKLDRTNRMVTNLLDANLIKAGDQIVVSRTEVDVGSLLAETIAEFNELYGPRFVLKDQTHGLITQLDREGMTRVLENLVGNAIKYGCPNAVITISANRLPSWLEISVNNRGNIIPAEEAALIFDPHQRSRLARSGSQPGWGVGLAVVKAIVTAHGGTVRVESAPSEGTTFILRFPLAPQVL
jgi:signal transduction histidine kinase